MFFVNMKLFDFEQLMCSIFDFSTSALGLFASSTITT